MKKKKVIKIIAFSLKRKFFPVSIPQFLRTLNMFFKQNFVLTSEIHHRPRLFLFQMLIAFPLLFVV